MFQRNIIRSINRVFYTPNKYTTHAEVDCIMKMKDKRILKRCSMLIVRLDKNDNCTSCGPCKCCGKIINKYGIKKIYTII